MGSYTTVWDSIVEIVDKPGLEKFIKDARDGKIPYYSKGDMYLFDAVKIEDEMLDFSGMDGWKIISYWYGDFVTFLRDIAVFVEGDVCLEFENPSEAGGIAFRNGKCIITTGYMEYTEHSPEEMGHGFNKGRLPGLPDELRSALVLRKLGEKK